jgi:hypothetical protein
MRKFTLKNYEEKLIRQVIHLDQGVTYNPEFRATRMMCDYPSRKAQLGWSVYKGYLKPNEYIAKLLFQSILSRQGERWQNFYESPEDMTDVMILLREMILKKGFANHIPEELNETLRKNKGHIVEIKEEALKKWQENMPTDSASQTYLLLDDATAAYTYKSARTLGLYFRENDIAFYPEIKPIFPGWEYFAYGLIDDGITYIESLINELKEKNIKTVMTLSGQTEYLFKKFLAKLPVEHPFEIVNVLDGCQKLNVDIPSLLYAGSFYLRYLDKGDMLNNLVVNTKEEPVKNAPEFTPLVRGDKRINILNRWQKPLCAEYHLIAFDEDILKNIEKDFIEDLKKTNHEQIVVFEPYAFNNLITLMPDDKITYFFDLL